MQLYKEGNQYREQRTFWKCLFHGSSLQPLVNSREHRWLTMVVLKCCIEGCSRWLFLAIFESNKKLQNCRPATKEGQRVNLFRGHNRDCKFVFFYFNFSLNIKADSNTPNCSHYVNMKQSVSKGILKYFWVTINDFWSRICWNKKSRHMTSQQTNLNF